MSSIRSTLKYAARTLSALPQTEPGLEAQLLLSEAIGKDRSHLYAWPDKYLNPQQQAAFKDLLQRRLNGEPIAYILGHREFWSLDLRVTLDVLIPRPDTELLVELALGLHPASRPIQAADLGTGSGAIAAALAHERPSWRILATDLSPASLAIAQENFHRLGLRSIETRVGSWCHGLPEQRMLDLIVCNPPYVAAGDPHLTRGDLVHEPLSALASGPDGMDAIREIAVQAPPHLAKQGWLLLEHGFEQGEAVRETLHQSGFRSIATHRDLTGLERATLGRAGS